jgi:hypothetical protein
MGAFKRKTVRFVHRGIQLNRNIESIQEDQIAFGRNIRVVEDGSITSRPGLTVFSAIGGTWTHSIARLNNFNTQLVNDALAYVIGEDNKLYVGPTSANLLGAANPVKLPPAGATTTLSGNPLTMVDMSPVGGTFAWKYIGDANMNLSVGYYPGDDQVGTGNNANGMARALTMGMTPPTTPITPPGTIGAGVLNGNYQWRFAYRNKFTGARSNPSAATRTNAAVPTHPALPCVNNAVLLFLPNAPIDPISGAGDPNIVIDIYRYGGTVNDWRLVGTAPAAGGFTDNTPDSAIITGITPPEITDATTGVTRYPLFRPFVTADNAAYNSAGHLGTLFQDINGHWRLSATGPDTFNLDWLPGSIISINNAVFTIYQVHTSTTLELTESASSPGAGNYAWATQTGTLKAGTPLPHIWGPWGLGEAGAYIFGCGDPNSMGTLYWTNGNDPDSADLVNSLVVTSPSEPLRSGCIYDGTCFVWSTERMFRVYAGNVPGQFTVQELPGGKGILAEYSLTVQSNGISDQSVSWVGKDGIYDYSNSQGVRCLSDRDLFPIFPHDNQTGVDPATIYPMLSAETIGAPNCQTSVLKYHRLCWFQGMLYYDYPVGGGLYSTLVYDSKNVAAWVSFDRFSAGTNPVSRGIEIAANNLKVGVGGVVCDYTGTSDFGANIACRVVTRQDISDDGRIEKLYGDYWLDCATPGSTVFKSKFWTNYGATAGLTYTLPQQGRSRFIGEPTPTGLGILSKSFGLDITWTEDTPSTPCALYQWALSWVDKPEITGLRALDKTDDGYNGAKYLRGFCIEANTFAQPRQIKVLVDGVAQTNTADSTQIFTVNNNGQLEVPFAVLPVVAYEMQIAIDSTDASTAGWEVFQIRWVWEKWPDQTIEYSPFMSMGSTHAKYIRGFTIPIAGAPVATSMNIISDGNPNYIPSTTVTPPSASKKTTASFAFNPPLLAHEVQLFPNKAVRLWWDEIVWDAEEWPELIAEYGPVDDAGTRGAKYLRGFEVPIETNGNPVVLRLLYDTQIGNAGATSIEVLPAVVTAPLSKNVFPMTPAAPIIAHEFQIQALSPARVWWKEVKWDFEPWPEYSAGRSEWLNAGTPSAKFMQGVIVSLDTGGLSRSITYAMILDTGEVHPIGPFSTIAGTKTSLPFSFPVPFICHQFQITPNGPVRDWPEEFKWIWEPVPELVPVWTTQETDHDLPGFHYMFDAYVAYIGTDSQPLFSITTEYSTITYPLPVSNGVFTRAHLMLQPQKAKWRSYSVTAANGLRLFVKDTEVRVKNWSDKGVYPAQFESAHPFGDESRARGASI